MATKGIQASDITVQHVAKAAKGQDAKRDARKARRNQERKIEQICVIHAANSEEALHALFSFTRKTINGNHVTRKPFEVVGNSRELRRAIALHGIEESRNRIIDALTRSGIIGDAASAFVGHAIYLAA